MCEEKEEGSYVSAARTACRIARCLFSFIVVPSFSSLPPRIVRQRKQKGAGIGMGWMVIWKVSYEGVSKRRRASMCAVSLGVSDDTSRRRSWLHLCSAGWAGKEKGGEKLMEGASRVMHVRGSRLDRYRATALECEMVRNMWVGGRWASLSPNLARAIGRYTDIGKIALI